MSIQTRSQKLAQAAYDTLSRQGMLNKEYVSFAKKFPALIHTCGLAQSIAFALAKGLQKDHNKTKKPELLYVEDLAEVLSLFGHDDIKTPVDLSASARDLPLSGYIRLSRDTIEAASWLKRYAEASGVDD